MNIYIDLDILNKLEKSYVFLDNDFLGLALLDSDVSDFLIEKFTSSHLMIDPLTEFEFRRDVFVPTQINIRKRFVNQDIFSPVTDHYQIYNAIKDNALLLSQIYAHQTQNIKDKNKAPSLVDIFLAARMMWYSIPTYLITGNKKDFPSCIFDVVGVFNIEQKDGSMKPISVVSFNKEKFNQCYTELTNLVTD